MIYKSYKIDTGNVKFVLNLKDRMVLVDGLSGVGKTLLYKAIMQDALTNRKDIICLNRNDIKGGETTNIDNIIKSAKNKLIVIDNAEVILSLDMRYNISVDKNNQYIIFTHNTDGFKPRNLSFATLEVNNNKGELVYDLE